ncbi:hypothetical protein BJ322DRAFT_264305 [Thelephora terrestris]|uniref:Uncharacterized protein n=1 Tax=Thelephora terrestris TaxID=56493 RepID=A0A9P6H7Q5_9AGAM|nr:hypothetical protein BJ322DRAFT_264305 [Thelephora terrestris]
MRANSILCARLTLPESLRAASPKVCTRKNMLDRFVTDLKLRGGRECGWPSLWFKGVGSMHVINQNRVGCRIRGLRGDDDPLAPRRFPHQSGGQNALEACSWRAPGVGSRCSKAGGSRPLSFALHSRKIPRPEGLNGKHLSRTIVTDKKRGYCSLRLNEMSESIVNLR